MCGTVLHPHRYPTGSQPPGSPHNTGDQVLQKGCRGSKHVAQRAVQGSNQDQDWVLRQGRSQDEAVENQDSQEAFWKHFPFPCISQIMINISLSFFSSLRFKLFCFFWEGGIISCPFLLGLMASFFSFLFYIFM
uniref:Uncharacterized protein n=1 Tax=Opuntia streptacantha TaxID=393608 RepID=A0A7C8ZF24_OPUST